MENSFVSYDRGKLRVSNLGKRLTYPENEEELMNAIIETVKNVPLWKMFFDTFTAKVGRNCRNI